jgi:hypothetical protein
MDLKFPVDMGESSYNIFGRQLGAPLTRLSALFVSIDRKDGKILRTIEPYIELEGARWPRKERMGKVVYFRKKEDTGLPR